MLFHILGWRIYKQRNEVIFNSQRRPIPLIVNKAVQDYHLWMEASDYHKRERSKDCRLLMNTCENKHILESLYEIVDQVHQHSCLVDASWVSPTENIGIGWSLHDSNLMQLLHGSGSLPPTQSSECAEVEALRMAVVEWQRLGYRDVTFCRDIQRCIICYNARI